MELDEAYLAIQELCQTLEMLSGGFDLDEVIIENSEIEAKSDNN